MNKIIILDRDGVINYDSDQYIKSLDEFIFIPNSIKAIGLLSRSGYKIGIATNQSGIYRKYYTLDTLDDMHKKLIKSVKEEGGHLDKICYCPHGPDQDCPCRKPKTGMLTEIFSHLQGSKEKSYMVGDSLSDLQCAQNFGIKAILLKTGKGERTIKKMSDTDMDNQQNMSLKNSIRIFENLYDFALHLTSTQN